MRVGAKLSLFAAGTFALAALAFGAGSLVDPIAPRNAADSAEAAGQAPRTSATPTAPTVPAGLPGLAVAERGYTLAPLDSTLGRGEGVEFAFTVAGPDGTATTDFATTHEKQMHLIVVRRDLTRFQHLHPERDAAGVWRTPVDLSEAGAYRVFADFAPAALGETVTLGSDVFVSGDYVAAEPSNPSTVWTAEGYTVDLSGLPRAGSEAELSFTVRRDGVEVRDLEPYLGAFGHLVSLREGDLAYLHTHPSQEVAQDRSGGPAVRFATTFPTAGRYRLYLNFAHAGIVRTAEFTVVVPAGEAAPATSQPPAGAPAPPAGHTGH
ncbi:MAG: hypothetical protein ACT4QF_25015 [Sporichthyaceae bacterium]